MLEQILTAVPALLIAVVLHEIAHGWVAERLGDPTARLAGRLTLNPLKHIDPFMTIILPGMLIALHSPIIFGGAKPVPVDPSNFRNPRKEMIWVAVAGPATNLLLALVSLAALFFAGPIEVQSFSGTVGFGYFLQFLVHSVYINVILAAFNLIPFPPLDGGRIMVGLLPLNWARRWGGLERYGIVLVLALVYFNGLDWLFGPIASGLQSLVQNVLGLPSAGS